MELIINDITILSEFVETINKNHLELMGITFHTLPMALDKSLREEAATLGRRGVLSLDVWSGNEEDTAWIMDHSSVGVGFDDLCFVRYAKLRGYTLLTNDPVLTAKAHECAVEVVDVDYLSGKMRDNTMADERQTDDFLVRVFRHRKAHWRWFCSQHLQLGRIAALL